MGRSDASRVRQFVIEHQAERTTATGDGEAVRSFGGNHKQIASPGRTTAALDSLDTLARQIQNQLNVGVTMWSHFGVTVTVELQFTQDETEGVDFNLLDKQRAPGVHKVAGVLCFIGIVLTQATDFT